ncbi:hypothetical protein HanOQP8_Chr01g0017431 [Helianthus annuus]|nr:hypothetical protein HanOQP8_Chr01g0017431 [Helianthus annuus]
MQKVYTSMEKIKTCYVWTKTYGDAEIAQMMVMDACFILELIYQSPEIYEKSSGKVLQHANLIRDLLLLENQIPFFFLDQIFECTILKFDPNASLALLIYRLIEWINPFENIDISNIPNNTYHILSLLHDCYKPLFHITPHPYNTRIPPAIDLDRAGVNFKPNKSLTLMPLGMEVKLSRFTCLFWVLAKPYAYNSCRLCLLAH